MSKVMLTTNDNPFSPFTEFDEWLAFDEIKGYRTLNFLARVVTTSGDLSLEDQERAIDLAIDEIVENNVLGIYRKFYEDDTDSEEVKEEIN